MAMAMTLALRLLLFRLLLSIDNREHAEPGQRLSFRRLGGSVGEIYPTYEFGRRERRLSMGLAGQQGRLLEVVSSLENQTDIQLLRLVRERAPRLQGD